MREVADLRRPPPRRGPSSRSDRRSGRCTRSWSDCEPAAGRVVVEVLRHARERTARTVRAQLAASRRQRAARARGRRAARRAASSRSRDAPASSTRCASSGPIGASAAISYDACSGSSATAGSSGTRGSSAAVERAHVVERVRAARGAPCDVGRRRDAPASARSTTSACGYGSSGSHAVDADAPDADRRERVAAVGKLLRAHDAGDGADVEARVAAATSLPRSMSTTPNSPSPRSTRCGHRAVARLEHVQREQRVREQHRAEREHRHHARLGHERQFSRARSARARVRNASASCRLVGGLGVGLGAVGEHVEHRGRAHHVAGARELVGELAAAPGT